MAEVAPRRLLTFAPMIDSETTRLVCRWYRIPFVEQDHLFGWVSLLTFVHGGYGRVPLLYGPSDCFSGPRPVVDEFDPQTPPDRRLLPPGAQAASVEADWGADNGQLAGDVAGVAYFHLLAQRDLMTPIFQAPVPPTEARLTPTVYPALRWLLTTLLGVNYLLANGAAVLAGMARKYTASRRWAWTPAAPAAHSQSTRSTTTRSATAHSARRWPRPSTLSYAP